MELKPEKKNVNPKYPNEDEINNQELNKPLKKWKKVGITAAVLASLGIVAYVTYRFNVTSGDVIYFDEEAIVQFNNRLEAYEGDRVNGDRVKRLITEVRANNLNDRIVTINNTLKTVAELREYMETISNEKTYEVKLEYNDEEGFIENINIKEVENIQTTSKIKEEKKHFIITEEEFIKKIEEIIEWANHNGLA